MSKPKSKSAPTKAPAGRSSHAKAPRRGPAPVPRAAEPEEPEEPHRAQRSDDADAFLPDPADGPARSNDDLAEVLAEDFLESATRGNDVYEDDLERETPDEVGGPFIVTESDEELADDVDESNPLDAEPAPRPRAVGRLVQRPKDEKLSEEDEPEDEDEDEEDDDDTEEVEGEVDQDKPPKRAR